MRTPAILRRIRHLLALAESPNPHEAALAAEEARRLLARHNLQAGDVAEPERAVVRIEGRGYAMEQIAVAVAASRGCLANVAANSAIEIRGLRPAAEDAAAVYRALVEAAWRAPVPRWILHFGRDAEAAWGAIFWSAFTETVLARLAPAAPPGDVVDTTLDDTHGQGPIPQEAPKSHGVSGPAAEAERIGKIFDRLGRNPLMSQYIDLIYQSGYEEGSASASVALRPYREPYRPPAEPRARPAVRGLLGAVEVKIVRRGSRRNRPGSASCPRGR